MMTLEALGTVNDSIFFGTLYLSRWHKHKS
jgi:hypothetical protein